MRLSLLIPALACTALSAQNLVDLFPADSKCACIPTRKMTASAISKELVAAGRLWQVFSDAETGKEMFRLDIGLPGKFEAKLWNYGITIERDMNADGMMDYAWYGGDDSITLDLLLLSTPSGYRVININKSASAMFARLLKTNPPVLNEVGGDFGLEEVSIETGPNPILIVKVETDTSKITFRVPTQDY